MKPIDILGAIVSLVALVGSLIAMYVLVQLGAAMAQFSTTTAQLGSSVEQGIAQFAQVMQMFISLAWLWSIAVLLASLYGLWSAWQKQKKK